MKEIKAFKSKKGRMFETAEAAKRDELEDAFILWYEKHPIDKKHHIPSVTVLDYLIEHREKLNSLISQLPESKKDRLLKKILKAGV